MFEYVNPRIFFKGPEKLLVSTSHDCDQAREKYQFTFYHVVLVELKKKELDNKTQVSLLDTN